MPSAFPFLRSEAIPDGATESARLLDNRIRELRADMDAIFGIPDNVTLTGPIGSMSPSGVFTFASQPLGTGTISQISVQIFTVSGTYTKPATLRFAQIIGVAGGAGGGGPSVAAATRRSGGGGGAGGTAFGWFAASAILATETVTVGGAGAGGSGGIAGNSGSASSFGALISAGSGTGGGVNPSDDTETAGGIGGVGVTGQILIGGSDGGHGLSALGAHIGGSGGSSTMGGGGKGAFPTVAAQIGRNFGGGGGGGISVTGSASPGAVGGNGVVIVIEFKS